MQRQLIHYLRHKSKSKETRNVKLKNGTTIKLPTRGNAYGVLVAEQIGEDIKISWSMMHPKDRNTKRYGMTKDNKELCIELAKQKTHEEAVKIPHSIIQEWGRLLFA